MQCERNHFFHSNHEGIELAAPLQTVVIIRPPGGKTCDVWRAHILRLLPAMVFLLVLAGAVFSALAYPFRLPEGALAALDAWSARAGVWGSIYSGQLRAQLAFTHSRLIYKECVAAGFLLAAILALAALRSMEQAGTACAAAALRRLTPGPSVWIALLLAYTGASALIVSPTFFTSLWAFLIFALVVVSIPMLAQLPLSRDMAGKFMAVVCVCGAVITAVAILQHVGLAGKFFMPTWDDPRNRLGSLIGHNTAAASWLLFPLCFSLYYLMCGQSRMSRVAGGILSCAAAFVIVASQSRAVWIIALALVPSCLYALSRASGQILRLRFWLAGLAIVALIIASQSVAPRRNPLARHEVPLAQRVLRGYSPRQLLHETRLRIFVCSMPLIAQRPMLGHGFGSFQYVYPPAQGEYFRSHPGTPLALTAKRTDLAHNDYLQMLVETGLTGCALAAVPLLMLLRRGWKNFRAMPAGRGRATMIAMFVPMAGVAVHALFDFPFHVMPTALMAAMCLSFWASLREEQNPPLTAVQADIPSHDNARPLVRTLLMGGSVLAISLAVTTFAFQLVLRQFMGDIYVSDAGQHINLARNLTENDPSGAYASLVRARNLLRRSTRVNIFNGQAYEGLASAQMLLGQLDYNHWQKALAQGDTTSAAYWRKGAVSNYEAAIYWAQLQLRMRELRTHSTYYMIGASNHMLWRINPADMKALTKAGDALQAAADLNPGGAEALFELAGVLEEFTPPDMEGAARARATIFRHDPDFGYVRVLAGVWDAADRGDFGEATQLLARHESEQPDAWAVRTAKADLLQRAALWPPAEMDGIKPASDPAPWFEQRMAQGERLLEDIERAHGDEPRVKSMRMLYDTARGRYDRALETADRLAATGDGVGPDFQVFRWMLAQKTGRNHDAAPISDTEFLRRMQIGRLLYFNERLAGARQISSLANAAGVGVYEGMRAAAYLLASGLAVEAAPIAAALHQSHPADPAIGQLWKQTAGAPAETGN